MSLQTAVAVDSKSSTADLLAEVPLRSLSHLTVNWSFIKRAGLVLRLGWRSPMVAPRLWLLILFNIGFQITGAYIIQSHLYIISTGRDNIYPGIAGCLKNGCGNVKVSPGQASILHGYFGDFGWAFAVSMTFVILMSFSGDLINTAMRKNVSETVQRRLLQKDNLLYRLTVDGTMDNIDQRITSDLQIVLDGFICVLFGNSADYLAYPIVFMIGRFAFAFNNAYALPEMQNETKRGQVFGIVAANVAIAITAYILPINHIARVFFRGQKFEGDFRTTHTRVVLNAEQISMLHGEQAERDVADMQYRRVDANNRIYYFWQGVLLILRLFVTVAIPASSYLSLAVCATTNSTTANFFQKQIGDVLEYMLYMPVLCERLAFACGATHRVGELLEEMDKFEASPVKAKVESKDDRIELKDVWANPPLPMPTLQRSGCLSCLKSSGDGAAQKDQSKSIGAHFGEEAAGSVRHSLFESVNMVVKKGESLCIVGPSGCGKSSLLRVIGGLWGIDEGLVVRPKAVGRGGVFFLPQRPYVFSGTLQAMICYPNVSTGDLAEKERAENLLKVVYLEHLVRRYGMDTHVNWAAVLSISEMQRLNFARMFFHEPCFCLADECTAALDLRLESFLYETCAQRKISMISIAHRPTVIPHHDFVFRYDPSTHRWSQVLSADVQTCGKFPSDGLEQDLQDKSDDAAAEVEMKEEGFNLKFVMRLWRAVRLGIRKCSSQSLVFLFIMSACMGLYAGMVILIFRDYGTSKIIARIVGDPKNKIAVNLPQAFNDIGVIIALNAVVATVQALSCFLGAIVAVKIQRGIMKFFHENYFAPGVVYHVNRIMKEKGIDQRMVQDMAGFRESLAWLIGNPFAYCNYRIGFLPLLIVWIILLIYAFTNSWQLTLFMLVFMLLSYVSQTLSSVFTSVEVQRRQSSEGDLRLHLARVIQNIETITFFGGQVQEESESQALLEFVFRSRLRYGYLANATTIPTITMYYWLQTGIYVMAGILQLDWAPGSVPSATLFTTINFNIIWAKVTQLMIMCLGGLGMVVGFTHRVMHIVEKVDEANEVTKAMQGKLGLTADSVVFQNVSITVPSKDVRVLVKDLSLAVSNSLCVSGHAKSSIMRVLAGMWPTAGGSVSRPAWGRGGIFFVPQSNYAVQGTLAAQVIYPFVINEVSPSDQELTAILEEVGMGAIARRWGLHKAVNWDLVLSGGECQRLGFARVLYHQPRFAVLDETTSALDMDTETRCMQALVKRGIKVISFSTRPSVRVYHDQLLHVSVAGVFEVSDGPGKALEGDEKVGVLI